MHELLVTDSTSNKMLFYEFQTQAMLISSASAYQPSMATAATIRPAGT